MIGNVVIVRWLAALSSSTRDSSGRVLYLLWGINISGDPIASVGEVKELNEFMVS